MGKVDKVTYLELMEMIKKGTNPETVKYRNIEYYWESGNYVMDTDETVPYAHLRLRNQMNDWQASTKADIEYEVPILDRKEKEYLKNVIKAFPQHGLRIEKRETPGYEYIKIHTEYANILFPIFNKGEMYAGMEVNKRYKPSQLGLL